MLQSLLEGVFSTDTNNPAPCCFHFYTRSCSLKSWRFRMPPGCTAIVTKHCGAVAGSRLGTRQEVMPWVLVSGHWWLSFRGERQGCPLVATVWSPALKGLPPCPAPLVAGLCGGQKVPKHPGEPRADIQLPRAPGWKHGLLRGKHPGYSSQHRAEHSTSKKAPKRSVPSPRGPLVLPSFPATAGRYHKCNSPLLFMSGLNFKEHLIGNCSAASIYSPRTLWRSLERAR